jgi:hypothetical protein
MRCCATPPAPEPAPPAAATSRCATPALAEGRHEGSREESVVRSKAAAWTSVHLSKTASYSGAVGVKTAGVRW